MDDEIPLPQGGTVAGVVRVGDTVRRPPSPCPAFARALLRQLEVSGVPGPRFLGIDPKGRDILSYIGGDAAHRRTQWPAAIMTEVVSLVRRMHDATAGSTLAGGHEVVCHNDLAPWNLIVDGDLPVAFVDFDDAAPGRRVDDLAYLAWTFLGLGDATPADVQAQRLAQICSDYGLARTDGLVDAIVTQQERVLAWRKDMAGTEADPGRRAWLTDRVGQIQAQLDWVQRHRARLEAAL